MGCTRAVLVQVVFPVLPMRGIKTEKWKSIIFASLLKEMALSDHTSSLEKKHDATDTHDQNTVFPKHNRMTATV